MQVEGMGCARGVGGRDREGELDGRVGREGVDAAAREEVRGGLRTAHDLEEDWDGGRDERLAVDEERGAVLRVMTTLHFSSRINVVGRPRPHVPDDLPLSFDERTFRCRSNITVLRSTSQNYRSGSVYLRAVRLGILRAIDSWS